jgi:hypothetical protein
MSEYVLAIMLAPLGRFDEAIGHGEAAVRVAEETDHPWRLFPGLLHLGWAHLGRGDFPRAARVLERCLHFGRTWQFVYRTPDVAATLDHEALALAEPRGMRPQVAHCHLGLGKLHRRRGDRQQAEEHLATAMAMYREMGMAYWLEQAVVETRQLG